jgi:site-specific recombinase XerD
MLQETVDLLGEYVEKWRPILLGESKSGSLFIRNRGGKQLTRADLISLVKSLTRRYAGVSVTPGSIKSSFVDYWLEKYPDGWSELAGILWMEYASVRQAFDPNYQNRFSGKTA